MTERQVQIRQCLVTRERHPAAQMIRFVLDPEARVVPDIRRRLPGRGVWVRADHRLVAEAVRKRLFARGFRRAVIQPDDLAGMVDRLLQQDGLAALSLARKSGLVVTGYEKVRAQAAKGGLAALIAASDGAEDGKSRLRRLATAAGQAHNPVTLVDVFSSEALSAALGIERVVHGAVLRGAMAPSVCDKAIRLQRYRTGSAGDPHAALSIGTHEDTDFSEQETV